MGIHNMPLLQPFLLLLFAQSGFCLTRQKFNISNKECNEKHLEIFTKLNMSSSDSYYLIVKEKLTSIAALSDLEEYYLTDNDRMVEYQSKYTGWNYILFSYTPAAYACSCS
jgi:hypothetical protein